nr:DoxX-like family protein [Bryobacterales bacterium]
FHHIRYLPRPDATQPQQFVYSTRIGFGLRIEGRGESTGERDLPGGARSSALRFWSADRKSLIAEGSGYWKYVPQNADSENLPSTRFFTWYDYETRFGLVGRLIDRFAFRPLIGWATAWSFDSMRLWLERGLPPSATRRAALLHAVARLGIAFIWLWQGAAPKLWAQHPDEVYLLNASGLSITWLPLVGVVELMIAALAVLTWRWRGFFWWNIAAMVAALLSVAVNAPQYLVAAFNPVTLNAAVIALALVGILAHPLAPFASRCLRMPPQSAITHNGEEHPGT